MMSTNKDKGIRPPANVEPKPIAGNPSQVSSSTLACPCGKVCRSAAGLKLHGRVCPAYKTRENQQRSQTAISEPSIGDSEETVTLRSAFPCEHCGSGYASQRGLATHMQKKHPVEWNKFKKARSEADGPKQKRWGQGDFEILCLGEDEYLSLQNKGGLGINQYIQTYHFPALSIETIKSQRKTAAFNKHREERIALAATQRSEPEPEAAQSLTPQFQYNLSLTAQQETSLLTKELGDKILSVHNRLAASELQQANTEAVEVFNTLKQKFTPIAVTKRNRGQTGRRRNKRKRKSNSPRISPSKAKRRELYNMVQDRWKSKRRAKVVEAILTGNLGKERQSPHGAPELDAFWRGIFEKDSEPDVRPIVNCRPIIPDLAKAITTEEVSEALKGAEDRAVGPDGCPLGHLKELGAVALAILYNGIFAVGKVPEAWKQARTILIPKEENPPSPAEYRPITISSYYYRIYSSALSKRIASSVQISPRQKGFVKEDGIRDNLTILETLLRDSKEKSDSLCLSFMDVRKAFDSVSHASLFRALEWAGIPTGLRNVITDLYTGCTTTIGGDAIKINRGVKQGDPLSSVLFNLVVEMALSDIPEKLGVMFQGNTLCYLAFADDLVIIARNRACLQKLVTFVEVQLGSVGLDLHPMKCKSLIIVGDGKRKTTYVDSSQKILINGTATPSMDVLDCYKYLGIRISSRGASQADLYDELSVWLDRTSRAPLRPNQRLFMLKVHIIPKLIHRLIFEKVSQGELNRLDKLVRVHVRKWLWLPSDTPVAAFFADVASGGLGIICLKERVSLMKRQRLLKMRQSSDNLIREVAKQEPVKGTLHSLMKRCKKNGSTFETKGELARITREDFWSSCDGKGLRSAVHRNESGPTVKLLTGASTPLRASQFIGAWGVRMNVLQTPCRKNRAGRNPESFNFCDKCPMRNKPATLAHISQSCPATHGLRVKRHDRIVNKLKQTFESSQSVTCVSVEPRLRCGPNRYLRKPDLLIDTENSVEIIDVQVVSDAALIRDIDDDEKRKLDRYRTNEVEEAARTLLAVEHTKAINVSAFTVTWRGSLAPHSHRLAKRLKFKTALPFIVADVLADTFGMFVSWNKSS